jgi:hypothetical protein
VGNLVKLKADQNAKRPSYKATWFKSKRTFVFPVFWKGKLMTRKEEAKQLTEQAREHVLLAGRSWTAYAAICARMIEEKLYEEIGFETFGAWCDEVGGKSASQSYDMAKTYTELKETIPEPAIAQMTIENARDLTQIPARQRTADVVEKGTRMKNREFRKALNVVVPDLHLEETGYKGFKLDKSALRMSEQAIALAKKELGIEDDAGAYEAICSYFLAGNGQDEHYRATKALVDVIEEQIDPEKLSAPPDKKGWASVLVTARRAARVFGFSERRVMPTKSAEHATASTRVN